MKTLEELRAESHVAREVKFHKAVEEVMTALSQQPDYHMKLLALDILLDPNDLIKSAETEPDFDYLQPVLACSQDPTERHFMLATILSHIAYHIKCNHQTQVLHKWMREAFPNLPQC